MKEPRLELLIGFYREVAKYGHDPREVWYLSLDLRVGGRNGRLRLIGYCMIRGRWIISNQDSPLVPTPALLTVFAKSFPARAATLRF